MKQKPKTIRIVSLPRLRRLGREPGKHYVRRDSMCFFVDEFTTLHNPFKTHLDGGAAMYREWLRSQLESSSCPAYLNIRNIWNKYHHDEHTKQIVLLVDNECNPPPIHAVIIRDFIESAGAKL